MPRTKKTGQLDILRGTVENRFKWTYVEDREFGENSTQFHVEEILSELDLSHVD
jgi:hypothetical protein